MTNCCVQTSSSTLSLSLPLSHSTSPQSLSLATPPRTLIENCVKRPSRKSDRKTIFRLGNCTTLGRTSFMGKSIRFDTPKGETKRSLFMSQVSERQFTAHVVNCLAEYGATSMALFLTRRRRRWPALVDKNNKSNKLYYVDGAIVVRFERESNIEAHYVPIAHSRPWFSYSAHFFSFFPFFRGEMSVSVWCINSLSLTFCVKKSE